MDRNQILADSSKLPNILETTKAVSCESNKHCSLEKRFKNKLTVDNDDFVMDAMVMHNDICVLMCKKSMSVQSLNFPTSVHTENISGKQKKGAQNIKAGHIMCEVTLKDGLVCHLKTPVGGKLLEINEALLLNPSLLETHHSSSGFIAIIYPNTEIPSLVNGGCVDYHSLLARINSKHAGKSNACFAFSKGNCTRGDSCRFEHTEN